jgi:hypothetical protein
MPEPSILKSRSTAADNYALNRKFDSTYLTSHQALYRTGSGFRMAEDADPSQYGGEESGLDGPGAPIPS